MKILVADDDAISRLILTDALRGLGHEVVATRDGVEAWAAWRDGHFPLVISDWVMPRLDGLDLCRRIREEQRAGYTYFILLTAKQGKESYLAGMAAGAHDFIHKPFEEEQLSTRLRVAVRIIELQAALLATQEALRVQATRDALTGLENRSAVLDGLDLELARSVRGGVPLGVILTDIDHFKRINDTHGHPAGDAVLVEVSRRMRAAVRPYDRVGRHGGEEFLVVVPGCAWEEAVQVAERIRERIRTGPVPVGEEEVPVTASFGVAIHQPGSGCGAEELIRAADAALYRAKRQGRDRVALAEEGEAA